MAETNKQFYTSEEDTELLRQTFKGNEYLLKITRSALFGFDLSEEDKKLLKSTYSDGKLMGAVRRKIFPELNPESPIGQVADFWLGSESQIFGASRDTIYQVVASKQRLQKMFEDGFAFLANPDTKGVSVEYNPDSTITDELQVGLLARNLYIRTIETGLMFIKTISEQQADTPAEIKKKLKQNSGK